MTLTPELEAEIDLRIVERKLAKLQVPARVSPAELRARAGLDVVGLAKIARVQEITLRSWESGACKHPRRGSVQRVAKALGIEFETYWTSLHWRMTVADIGAEMNGVARASA